MKKYKSYIVCLVIYMLGMSYLRAQTFVGNGIVVAQDPGTDQAQSLTSINMTNRGLGGGGYPWSLFTAAVGGGYGVRSNAFEIWEYPNSSALGCCLQRFVIDKASSTSLNALIIDSKGGLALGGFGNAGANALSVNGNVGIGTTNTNGYALAVNGDIRSRSVKVEVSNWPDYVFKRRYDLLALSGVEAYIAKNNHLPGLPSEVEKKSNGQDLCKMVKLQTKKIDILTLYLIAQPRQRKLLKQL